MLDKIIAFMKEHGGEALKIQSGANIEIKLPAGFKPLRTKLTYQHTNKMFFDILPNNYKEEYQRGGVFNFIYDSPFGSFKIQVAKSESVIQGTIQPNLEYLSNNDGYLTPDVDEEEEPAQIIHSDSVYDDMYNIDQQNNNIIKESEKTDELPLSGVSVSPSGLVSGKDSSFAASNDAGLSGVADDSGFGIGGNEQIDNIDQLLHLMLKKDASDLHLTTGTSPIMRISGDMQILNQFPVITASIFHSLIDRIIPERNQADFEKGDCDFAYEIKGVGRFRCNLFVDHKGPGGVFRQIPVDIPSAEQLGIPLPILSFCKLTKGIVVVTGPTGSGKSTTLAAMVDHINKNYKLHIITIEDPIEFVHKNNKCLINQREVGIHTQSFPRALKAALREDPDIILVGEMRDLETISIAIETAETGHLVFGTLHTTTAPTDPSKSIIANDTSY